MNSSSAVWDREMLMERIDNDEELRDELITYFTSTIDEKIDRIHTELSRQNWENTRMFAHSVKGMLANIGGVRAQEAACRVEDTAAENNLEKCTEHMAVLRKEIMMLKKVLEN
jgi:HPt (histidine-containing phosphotransfer) domain-containing protein